MPNRSPPPVGHRSTFENLPPFDTDHTDDPGTTPPRRPVPAALICLGIMVPLVAAALLVQHQARRHVPAASVHSPLLSTAIKILPPPLPSTQSAPPQPPTPQPNNHPTTAPHLARNQHARAHHTRHYPPTRMRPTYIRYDGTPYILLPPDSGPYVYTYPYAPRIHHHHHRCCVDGWAYRYGYYPYSGL